MVVAYVLVTSLSVVVLVATIAVVSIQARRERASSPATDRQPEPVDVKGWDRHGTGEPSFRCRPLFLAEEHGHVRLDCLVTSGGPAAAAGAPVSLDVGLPDAGWLAMTVEALLSAWTDEQTVIDMSIAAHGRRIVVSNGESTIRLPLHATAGVARA